MRRKPRRLLAAAVVIAAGIGAAPAAPEPPPLVHLTLVEPEAEIRKGDASWRRAAEGSAVALGRELRVGPDAVARLELPWMALTLSAGARLRFPDAFLLSAVVEEGRVLVEAEEHESMKLVMGQAEVRGRGRAVVRQRPRATLVTCLSGRFRVASARRSVSLGPGQGSVVLAGRPPSPPAETPAPPDRLWPGRDPVYVGRSSPIELRWSGDAPAYQLELLPVGSDVVLLQRDVSMAKARIEIPWHGAFRWRVSGRDERGLEGPPSAEGLIAVE